MSRRGSVVSVDHVESVLWACARDWRTPKLIELPENLDWTRLLQVAQKNRAEPLLARALLHPDGPPVANDVADQLTTARARYDRWAELLTADLLEYLRVADEYGVRTIVMKGLGLGYDIYDDPGVRPGVDIDVLVPDHQVDAACAALRAVGFDGFWPNLLDDAYYRRHHLHVERCTADWTRWFEVHWAFDHPATTYLVDYSDVFARSTTGTFRDTPICRFADEDLLLSLSIHLVKHAVHLPVTWSRPDLGGVLLGDGMFVQMLDIAEVVRARPSLDWDAVVLRAREFRATRALHAVLGAARRLVDADVPEAVLSDLTPRPPGRVPTRVMHTLADAEVRQFSGEGRARGWDFLLAHRGGIGLRPVRILEAFDYLAPGADYLERRYGDRRARTAARHALRGFARFGRLAIDAGRATRKRDRHLRATGQWDEAKAHLDLGP